MNSDSEALLSRTEPGRKSASVPVKRLLFDVTPYRTTIVLMENERAVEIQAEQSNGRRFIGNIYKGIVQSILPGMSVAFIDIGEEKNAILHFRDMRVDRTREGGGRHEPLRRGEAPGNYIKVGSEITVQIAKEPIGSKGPKATMELTLPGHTLVLLSTTNAVCISKRFHTDANKERVRNILKGHIPDDIGVIARSESEYMDEEKILADLDSIIERWHEIGRTLKQCRAPKLVWSEESLVSRSIRDLMRSDVAELATNSPDEYAHIRSILSISAPHLVEKVRLMEDEYDLLERYNLNKQLMEALSHRVWLKSGAYIVFDRTEALTSIDVNTGRNVGSFNVRSTIFETNSEAALEIAHQLRLRNLGGIIIIDFIDMETQEDRDSIVAVLKEAMSGDPAKPVVCGMTRLGLVEVARRRNGMSLESIYTVECPCCCGNGITLSPDTVAIRARKHILTRVHGGNTRLLISAYPQVLMRIKEILAEDIRCGRIPGDIEFSFHNDVFMPRSEFDIKVLNPNEKKR